MPNEFDTAGFATRAVHVGNGTDKDSGAIKRPITMANSYALPYDPTDMNWSSADGNLYTRNGGTNQKYLQERIASLEGGEDCVVLASGVAALSGLFFALLNQGDHVIFSSVTYIAVYRLLHELLNNKFGVETTIVDTSDPANVEAASAPTPSSSISKRRAIPPLPSLILPPSRTLPTGMERCSAWTTPLPRPITSVPWSWGRISLWRA